MEPIQSTTLSPKNQINTWRAALPSQINDSFHLVINGVTERILAFSFPNKGLLNLFNSSNSKSNDTPQLVLFYGLGPDDQNNARLTFKIFANIVQDNAIQGDYVELRPLTRSTLSNYRKKHAIPTLAEENSGLMVNAQTVTGELIPGEIQRFLSYAWRTCPTSQLVDQTETILHQKRMRIERSIYDGQVYKLLGGLYEENHNNVKTLILLGLHAVIPGDNRRYPFGPIFKSYIPKTKGTADLETQDSDGTDEQMHPVDFELSKPCPPSCEPPDNDL